VSISAQLMHCVKTVFVCECVCVCEGEREREREREKEREKEKERNINIITSLELRKKYGYFRSFVSFPSFAR